MAKKRPPKKKPNPPDATRRNVRASFVRDLHLGAKLKALAARGAALERRLPAETLHSSPEEP